MAGLALACAAALPGARAAACALDQRPSLSVDGRLATVNRQAPATARDMATWSYFAVPGTFPTGVPLVLAEDRREVARTLTAQAMRQPCA